MGARKDITTLVVCLFLVLEWVSHLSAQPRSQSGLLFYQLNTSHGLSDNYIHSMAIDSSGNLWVGTGDGLNMFNGKTVTKFFRQEYPQITDNWISELQCDEGNRIWMLTYDKHIAIIDEDRRFHKVTLAADSVEMPVRALLYTKDAGMMLFVHNKHYQMKPGVEILERDSLTLQDFNEIHIAGFDTLSNKAFRQIVPFDAMRYVFSAGGRFYMINYVTRTVEKIFEAPNLYALTAWDADHLLAYKQNSGQLAVVDLAHGSFAFPFDTLLDQHEKSITGDVLNAYWIPSDQLLLTARGQGLYIYNSKGGQLTNYKHNPADLSTLAGNTPVEIIAEKNGWVFLGATPNGVSYFKSDAVIGQQTVFLDDHGHSYDGDINSVTTVDNDTYYIATGENLIKWQRSTNTSEFIEYDGAGDGDPNGPGIFYAEFDPFGRLWVSVYTLGIYVLDKNMKLVRHLINTPDENILPDNNIRRMNIGPDGQMWCTSNVGICRIDPKSLTVDQFKGLKLWGLRRSFTNYIWFQDADNVWVAPNNQGAWHYTISTDSLEIRNKANGLISDEVYCFNQDRNGNMYIGTAQGLQILLTNGKSKTITVEYGLLNNRIEALLLDKQNRMWMGNDVGLSCFSIADTSLKAFDERYGLSVYGFRLSSYHQNSDDELIWGTEQGLQYFYPDRLYSQTVSFPTTITRIETRDIVRDLTQNATLTLPPSSNYVTFYFSSIDYSKHLRTFYEYQLEGIDPDWTKVVDQNSVRYSALPSGEYTFRVRASNDDRVWEDANNAVTIVIERPIWERTWFRILAILGIGLVAWYVIRMIRQRQKTRQEELETQVVINYFASRISSYRKTEDLLWDVAEHCISKLHFEDCVIYLVDPTRHVLIQKAAFGPKMAKATSGEQVDFSVSQPIEIGLGKGIVGTVAQTGVAELVSDTSTDQRYIIDDSRRNSELAVPMKIDDKVIGVIDSEHSRKNFFTQKHMNILSTIAALCANQIQRVRAEDEKQQAMIEVLKNKQKVTESRLQSLRLQMNPHFLFNALNSIQQMILANEEMVATRYLSRFSKLLRTILIHSDKEMVTLKEEIDILRLYVDLESVRFKEAFQYDITCDNDMDIDEIKIPTLLVQPFVENAIWHGLMHKEGDRHLLVNFYEQEETLFCIIEDNGIGRQKAREMKLSTGQGTNHTSRGIAVSIERVEAMTGENGSAGSIEIHDLHNEAGQASGTRVEIKLPILN